MMSTNLEGWVGKKKILVILAHPDDPEFFCGAMISRWCTLGHDVRYVLLTTGQRGSQNVELTTEEISRIRISEQMAAANVLGVSNVKFLNYLDGELISDLVLREVIIREIRSEKPDILVTSDPQNLFPAENRINHPDHRAAGQAVVDAVFPAAGNPLYKLVDIDGKILPPHQVEEVWITLTIHPNIAVDLTDFFDAKIKAIACHRSQLRESESDLKLSMRSRFELDSETGQQVFKEKFKRIQFSNK